MRRVLWTVLALIPAASVVVEFLGSHHAHSHYWFSEIPLFWILFGFLGGCLLILGGKKILAWIVYRREDYYD